MERTLITPDAYREALAVRDLTDAAQGQHAMQHLIGDVIARLRDTWRCAVIVERSHPLVSLAENYELLEYPPDAPARDARYTRYVTAGAVLRTHTSAMVPNLLRSIAAAEYQDVLLACVGLVYRRDRIDRQSVSEPHQLDLWRISCLRLHEAQLREMIDLVVSELVPGCQYRANATSHPYTTSGLEVEIQRRGGWVEVAECGLAEPGVLARAGLAPDRYSGLAMGIGPDRALMLRKGIDDIRLLRSTDERVASQMLDLSRYRPVSSMPPVRRDISIAVAAEPSAEELGDRVRAALGHDAEAVEAVEILSRTPAEELPPKPAARLGIAPGQSNLLVRLVLRHPTRTLSADEANRLRDEVYAALHQGSAWQWASEGRGSATGSGNSTSRRPADAADRYPSAGGIHAWR